MTLEANDSREGLLKSANLAAFQVKVVHHLIRVAHVRRVLHDEHVDWLEAGRLDSENAVDARKHGLIARALQMLDVIVEHVKKHGHLILHERLDQESIVARKKEERAAGAGSLTRLKHLLAVHPRIQRVAHVLIAEFI